MFDDRLLESDSLLILRPQGTLDKKLSRELIEGIEKREAATQGWFDRLADMTQLDGIAVDLEDLREITRRRRKFNPNQGKVKAAFLADNPLAVATAKMYEVLLRSDRIQVRVFSRLEDAATWLEIDAEKLRPVRA